jgi:hypothetical protein
VGGRSYRQWYEPCAYAGPHPFNAIRFATIARLRYEFFKSIVHCYETAAVDGMIVTRPAVDRDSPLGIRVGRLNTNMRDRSRVTSTESALPPPLRRAGLRCP